MMQEKPSMAKSVDRCGFPKKKEPLLNIRLQDETSVPKVFYKGEEVTAKVRVSFDWETEKEIPLSGGTRYNIEYYEDGHKEPVCKGVALARGKYAVQ